MKSPVRLWVELALLPFEGSVEDRMELSDIVVDECAVLEADGKTPAITRVNGVGTWRASERTTT